MSDVWHVRGVSEEARKAAKMGAVGQDIRLGKWLEMAIMAHANWAGSAGAVADNPIVEAEEEILIPPGPDIEPRKRSEALGELTTTPGGTEITDYFLAKTTEEMAAKEPPKRRAAVKKTCAHGEPKGNNCWQCGGLAKVVE